VKDFGEGRTSARKAFLREGNIREEVNPVRDSPMLERIPPREWRDLAIAWFAITLAFTLIFRGSGTSVIGFVLLFGVSSVTVGVGFILHELAHKFTAMHYGYWAEFQKDNLMLLVAVAMAALAGVVFAAPGATVIYGSNLSRKENGWISASGAITNLLLAIPFVALAFFAGGLLPIIGVMGWKVNAMLASFNLLPVGPLDGKKVLAWNPGAFVLLIGAAFVLLYLSFSPSLLSSLF
jgi:Zn-dependent protease